MTVAVAGATGVLGREVVALLKEQGVSVRALGRDADRLAALETNETRVFDLRDAKSAAGVCAGAEALILCAGAPVRFGGWEDRAGFTALDYLGNLSLLGEARRAGVRRVVSVSLAGALAVRHTEYARAHEQFVQALAASGLSYCVVRPTGFFHSFAALLPMAARGWGFMVGAGHHRTNPIHEGDVARACVEALGNGEAQMVVGGPDVFTRERLSEMAFEALSRPARVCSVPRWVLQVAAMPLGWVHPRMSALVRFGAAAGTVDLVAPAYGTRRLGDYLREHAARFRAGPRLTPYKR
jgi:uncharacterized protein YbjT (DUF2867 family)